MSHIWVILWCCTMNVVTISFSAPRMRRGIGGNRNDAPEIGVGDGAHLSMLGSPVITASVTWKDRQPSGSAWRWALSLEWSWVWETLACHSLSTYLQDAKSCQTSYRKNRFIWGILFFHWLILLLLFLQSLFIWFLDFDNFTFVPQIHIKNEFLFGLLKNNRRLSWRFRTIMIILVLAPKK